MAKRTIGGSSQSSFTIGTNHMQHDRKKYIEAIKTQLEQNIFHHSFAVEACMAGIYEYLRANEQLGDNEPGREDWLAGGLLHDIDYGGEFKSEHPAKIKEALEKYGIEISETVLKIIKAHASQITGVKPENNAHWAILCADSLTGLITAVALILPSKKLADVKLSSVVKRFLKEPKFAAGTRREEVSLCANPDGLNIPIEKFIEICLVSMQKIAHEIGL
jgi:predicted hydrolase (HD superfamily)